MISSTKIYKLGIFLHFVDCLCLLYLIGNQHCIKSVDDVDRVDGNIRLTFLKNIFSCTTKFVLNHGFFDTV